MRNRKMIALLSVLVLSVGGLTGCPKDKTRRIAVAVDGFSLAMKHFQEAEIRAFEKGFVHHDDHRAIQTALIKIEVAQLSFDDVVRAGSTAGAKEVLNQALKEFQEIESQVFKMHPKAREIIEAALLTAKTFLATISAALE